MFVIIIINYCHRQVTTIKNIISIYIKFVLRPEHELNIGECKFQNLKVANQTKSGIAHSKTRIEKQRHARRA